MVYAGVRLVHSILPSVYQVINSEILYHFYPPQAEVSRK
jgi:hypothetical protein